MSKPDSNQNQDMGRDDGSTEIRGMSGKSPKSSVRNSSRLKRPPRETGRVVIDSEEQLDEDFWVRFKKALQTAIGAIVSFLFHIILLVVLAWFVLSEKADERLGLVAEVTLPIEAIAEKPTDAEMLVEITSDAEDNSIVESDATDNSLTEDVVEVPIVSETNENEASTDASPVENKLPIAPEQPSYIGGGLEGRQSGARSSLASQYGGTAESELAVENGLKWLANHQHPSGGWRIDFVDGPCNGRCRNTGKQESTTAATGLALMAFLGAGYTHKSGRYQKEIQDGLDYLKSRMRKSYFGGNLAEGTMYSQGIATIALCEAYNMTKDEQLRPYVESALEYIVTAQHSAGGWRYTPGEPGDITVTGWQMMAIKSCELADIDVPAATIRKARKFLDSVGDESTGRFGYQSKDHDPTSTAVGLLLSVYQGWSREHRGMIEGTRYITKQGPSENNIYFNYYATQLLFHTRHDKWGTWNQQMRDFLIESQSSGGHESGSWFFKEKYATAGGRLYTTAMAVMILEVYYRYLPLFDNETVAARN